MRAAARSPSPAGVTPPSRAFAPLDFLQLLAIAVIWGVNNVAAKIALGELPALMTVALRFAIVLACLFWCIKPLPGGRWRLMALMLVCVGPLHFGIQYIGLSMAHDLAPMVVAMQLWAPASVLFAALLLGERVGPLRGLGVGIAFAGVAAMSFDPIVFAQLGSLALVAGAACLYGLGTVLVRKIGPSVGPWAMQAWIALMSAPVLGAGSALFEQGQWEAVRSASWLAWGCVLFGAIVSSIVANAFMFRLVQTYEVSRTTPFLLLTPLISFTLGAIVLGDPVTWRIALGAGAALVGVALVAMAEQRFASRSR